MQDRSLQRIGSIPLGRLARTWIFVSIAALLFGVCAVFAYLMWDAHGEARENATRSVGNLSTALALDISRNVDLLDLSIQAVVEAWSNDEIRALKPSLRQLVLFDHSLSASHFGPILVLDPYGSVLASSDPAAALPGSYGERADFRIHAETPDAGLFVSDPFQEEVSGAWAIAFSRRINDAEGGFAGVVTGTLRLSYLHEAYLRMHLGADGLLSMFSANGVLIAREPQAAHVPGQIARLEQLNRRNDPSNAGLFEATSSWDGIDRLYGYHRVGGLPLFQYVAVGTRTIYMAFWQRVLIIGGSLGLLSTGILILLVVAKRELDERLVAERRLADLASTDDLTGLMNRRAFNVVLETLRHEAGGASQDISLLMIDVDQFKAYNDSYGHLAGDEVLRRIGSAIAGVGLQHGGTACRYGGEEFAMLLTQTGGLDALIVADDVRTAVLSLEVPHAGSASGFVTVSVGAACLQAGETRSITAALATADAELYRAKAEGRNRCFLAANVRDAA